MPTSLRSCTKKRGQGAGAAIWSNTLAYDELGRVLRVSDSNDYSVRYEYDAVGNRRLVDASYWDATAGARKA